MQRRTQSLKSSKFKVCDYWWEGVCGRQHCCLHKVIRGYYLEESSSPPPSRNTPCPDDSKQRLRTPTASGRPPNFWSAYRKSAYARPRNIVCALNVNFYVYLLASVLKNSFPFYETPIDPTPRSYLFSRCSDILFDFKEFSKWCRNIY